MRAGGGPHKLTRMRAEEISEWIAALAAPESGPRFHAARGIYDAGRAAARAATRDWRRDADLARLFIGEPTVGVAVRPEHFEAIRRANGSPKLAAAPPDEDVQEFELHYSGGVSLDILTPRQAQGSGAIARFLDRHGEGIQQVELTVTDVEQAAALLQEHFSIFPLYAGTRAGADGTRVNFFLLPVPAGSGRVTGGKILIELVQKPAE